MKTILYNPIFINPQAYYVFPRLTRWLRPDDSYKEPVNYIGQIEVTIIAYGEIGYTEYFEHTNYIDFTNFSNSYVRISLFTRLGSCVLGEWKIGTMEGDHPYIEPEVLASLKAVVIVGDKTNQDKDRDIVANLVDASNPFIISNAAYKLNSGYGKYETELSDARIWTQSRDVTSSPFSSSYNGLSGWIIFANTELTNSADMPSFKIQVKGLLEGQELIYRYYDSTGQTNVYSMTKDGEYTLPSDVRTAKPLISNTSGFQVVKNETNTITITQIPSYQGAFVTDGVDDFITIPTTVGGKQVLMKVNWQSSIGQGMLYDQRGIAFAIWNSDKYNDDETDTIPAYSARNGGNTYIDGILNKNILASQLRNITHNIVATNTMLNESSVSPTIGCRTEHDAYFTNMSLYDFMLFDEISTDDKIKELNEYVGIEGNTDDLFN